MLGRRILRVEQRRPDLRFPLPERFAERLEGHVVEALRRRAKYLLADLSSGEVMAMHLGMTGRFRVEQGQATDEPGSFYYEAGPNPAHDHVVLHLADGVRVTYNDARRFGFMQLYSPGTVDRSPPFDAMGVEPLGPDLNGAALARLFAGRRAPLKAALLDQRLVAGLGNIYVCEALFRSRLSPEASAGSIATQTGRPRAAAHRLAAEIKAVLNEAITVGGSTLRDHAQVDGSAGAFQERFRVYDREGEACTTLACRGVVRRLVQSGRSTFYCPECQPLRSSFRGAAVEHGTQTA